MKVDELVLRFVGDNSSYKKAAGEVGRAQKETREDAKKTSQEVGRYGKEGAEFFKGLASAAAKFYITFKAITGGTSYFARLIDQSASLRMTAENLGTTADELKKLENINQRFGGSAEQMRGTMKSLQEGLNLFKLTGDKTVLPWLNVLGVQIGEDAGNGTMKLRQYRDILMDLHKALRSVGAKAGNGDYLAGRSFASTLAGQAKVDEATFNFAYLDDEKFNAELDRQDAIVHNMNAAADSALRLKQQFQDLKQRFEQWAMSKIPEWEPKLMKLLKVLERISDWMAKHPKEMRVVLELVAAAFALAALKATGLLDILTGLVRVFGGLLTLNPSAWVFGLAGAFAFLYSQALDTNKLMKDLSDVIDKGFNGDFKGMRSAFGDALLDMVPQWDRFVEYVQNTSWGKKATDWAENAMEVVFAPRNKASMLKEKIKSGELTQRAADQIWDEFTEQFNKEHTTFPIDASDSQYQLGSDYRRKLANARLEQDAIATGGYTPGEAQRLGLPWLGGDVLNSKLSTGLSAQPNISIGSLTIVTQATDAKGIARDIDGALRQQMRNDRGTTARATDGAIQR